jgi:putative endonuclease
MLSPDSEKASSPNKRRADLGRRGEELAAAYLEQQGYRLVAANVTLPVGRNLRGATVTAEIDLVAYDGPTLCFVEVKTRASDWFAAPEVNVDRRKQRQVVRAARAYRHMLGLEGSSCRFDVVSIVLPAATDPAAKLQIEILRGYWTEERLKQRRWVERYWD